MYKAKRHKQKSMQYTIFVLTVLLMGILTSSLGAVFYVQYAKLLTNKVSELNINNTIQIGNSIGEVFENIENNALFLHQDPTVANYLISDNVDEAYIKLNTFINNKLAYEEFVSAINLIRLDGEQYLSNPTLPSISEELYEKLFFLKGRAYINTSIKNSINTDEFISYSRVINDINDIGQPIGILQLYFRKDKIVNLFNHNESPKGSEYYILDNRKVLISSAEKGQQLVMEEALANLSFSEDYGSEIHIINNEKKLVVYDYIENTEWILVSILPIKQIFSEKLAIRKMITVIILIIILISGIIEFYLSKWVFRPLELVEKSIKDVELGNYKIHLPEEGYSELRLLTHSFNKMSKRIDELINRIYEVQLKEKDAKIKALQASISPHFIYNTLDTICWMSRMENAFETCNLIEALSNLFRLSVKDRSITTVESELKHITSYIKIQECRHIGNIEFNIMVDDTLLKYNTVGFVLQPLVENAIIHGIEPCGECGKVDIKIKNEDDCLIFIVANEGQTVDIDKLEGTLQVKENEKSGIGFSNVHNRIKLNFGDDYGIYFEHNSPNGLRVIVKQPLLIIHETGARYNDYSDDCRR